MAEASQVGLEMDFTKVPIRQETIEICEIFDVNPYKLQSGNYFDWRSGRRGAGFGASPHGPYGCRNWPDQQWE